MVVEQCAEIHRVDVLAPATFVLEDEAAGLGFLIEAAVADEVKDVASALSQAALKAGERGLGEAVEYHEPFLDERVHSLRQVLVLALDVEGWITRRTRDQGEDFQRRHDLERPYTLRYVEVADDRCLSRQTEKVRACTIVEVLPREIRQLRRTRQSEPDSQSGSAPVSLIDAGTEATPHLAREDGIEERAAKVLRHSEFGGKDATHQPFGAAQAQDEVLDLEIGKGELEHSGGLPGWRFDHSGTIVFVQRFDDEVKLIVF